MKKIISFMMASILLLGLASCTQPTPDEGEKGKGELIIKFNDIVDHGTKAVTSNGNKPVTKWTKNIQSMVLLLVDGNTIVDVRTIERQTSDQVAGISRTFTDVVAGTYTAYIIANYDQTTTPFGEGKINPSMAINASSLRGQNINQLLLNLVSFSGTVEGTDSNGTNRYGEPAEIFMAVQNNVSVLADQPNTHPSAFSLTRIVSLVRVRLNQDYDPTDAQAVDNSQVKFDGVNGRSNFRIRRHGIAYNAATGAVTPATPLVTNVLYSAKKFKNATDFTAVSGDYSGDMGLESGNVDKTKNFTLYNEYLVFPGGNGVQGGNGDQKFDIVIGGLAPVGYTPLNMDNTLGTPLTAEKMIYWGGQVTGAAASNGILELNVRLTGRGKADVPDVNEYGQLTISVDLKDWGTVTEVPIEF